MVPPERSLRLFGVAYPLTRCLFWTPVFFLYLNQALPLDRVLQLHAIYYATVFVLEVPSGYLSDRVGRILTMRLAAAAGVLSCTLFLVAGSSFALFAAAQISMAIYFSFLSGTDASYHFDTLASLGREGEYGDREARLAQRGLFGAALACVLGGAAGLVDLRLAYVLALLATTVQLLLFAGMGEPPRGGAARSVDSFRAQLRACFALLKNPLLAWVFAYVVLQTSLEHIPYELAQPYLALVLGEEIGELTRTPVLSGLLYAGVYGVGALAAGRSMRVLGALGLPGVLLALTALQTVIIGTMAAWVHVAVIPLLLLRSVQPGVGHVVVNAAVAPRVHRDQRATYLSIHSLTGRLGYAGVLLAASALVRDGGMADEASLSRMLFWGTVLAATGLALLWLTRGRAREVASPQR